MAQKKSSPRYVFSSVWPWYTCETQHTCSVLYWGQISLVCCRDSRWVLRYLHWSGNLSWGVDVHLVEQWLQEVFILHTQIYPNFELFINKRSQHRLKGLCETHCEFLDLSGERRVESHVLKQGGSEPHTQAGFLTLAVFLQKQRGG